MGSEWGGYPDEIPCRCREDAEGNMIPCRKCEIHWHQVIDGGTLQVEMYP